MDDLDKERIIAIFQHCQDVLLERGVTRDRQGAKPLWKMRGYKGTLMHMDSKMLRIMRQLWEQDPNFEDIDMDDLYDLINYTAFTIVNILECNSHG